MSDYVIRIMCPKCMESSDYEFPNDIMFVKKDDFTTDLLNQGFTRGYQKGRTDGYSQAEKDYFAKSQKDREDAYNCGYAVGRANAIAEFIAKDRECQSIVECPYIDSTIGCVECIVEQMKEKKNE